MKKILSFLLVTSAILMFALEYRNYRRLEKNGPEYSATVKVSKVIDGKTFETTNGMTISLIGIEIPESLKHNNEVIDCPQIAMEYTSELLTDKKVQLEYDSIKTDSKGRTLAYVYLDGQMVNETLIQNGIAIYGLNEAQNRKYILRFIEEDNTAMQNRTGYWADYFRIKEDL